MYPCNLRSSTAPVGTAVSVRPNPRRSGLPSPPGKVSAKQTDEGQGAVAMHRYNLRSSTAPVGADDPVRPLLPVSSAPKGTLFEPILFFLCQKEKNGFNLPRKERGHNANRCPRIFSKKLSLQPSVSSIPTTRKVSALCASPFGDTVVHLRLPYAAGSKGKALGR